MADSLNYPSSAQYLPSHQYYSNPVATPVHISRPEAAQQRKRPKYTRSKTGCLTCRVKKIKCDESKPTCMRCTHGARECSWPEGVPARKKSTARREEVDGRPSTAGSSGLSDASTPPGRDHTPPRRSHSDLGMLPLASSRAPSEGYLPIHSVGSDHEPSRRQLDRAYPHSHQSSNSAGLSMIPETSQYASRYDQSYINGGHPSHSSRHIGSAAPYRSLSHQSSTSHWNHPPEPVDSYYHGHHGVLHDRPLAAVGHASPNEHSHNRYQ